MSVTRSLIGAFAVALVLIASNRSQAAPILVPGPMILGSVSLTGTVNLPGPNSVFTLEPNVFFNFIGTDSGSITLGMVQQGSSTLAILPAANQFLFAPADVIITGDGDGSPILVHAVAEPSSVILLASALVAWRRLRRVRKMR